MIFGCCSPCKNILACGLYLLVLKVTLFRFQGQTRIYKSQRSDFHKAMEEAILANNDILDPHFRAQQNVEGEGSCASQEYHYQDQVILIFFPLCITHYLEKDAENL